MESTNKNKNLLNEINNMYEIIIEYKIVKIEQDRRLFSLEEKLSCLKQLLTDDHPNTHNQIGEPEIVNNNEHVENAITSSLNMPVSPVQPVHFSISGSNLITNQEILSKTLDESFVEKKTFTNKEIVTVEDVYTQNISQDIDENATAKNKLADLINDEVLTDGVVDETQARLNTSIKSNVNKPTKLQNKIEKDKEKTATKAKNKSKFKATNAAKQKENERPKSSKNLAKPGPASKKQQLQLEPKVEKNKILIKRTRKPRNYLVASRYTKLENTEDENDSIIETSESGEADETRSRAKIRKKSSNARQRKTSSKRAQPARSRSPLKTFSQLRFEVTPKERNEDLISLKESEAEYLPVICDSVAKESFPRTSIQPASNEACFNSASSKSSIKITNIAESKESLETTKPLELSMECVALYQWVII